MWNIALAVFLAAHGLIHLGYITPAPADPRYPFNLNKSWLVTTFGVRETLVRSVGLMLCLVTVAGFLLAGFAASGLIIPQEWGLLLTVIPSIASLLLLVVCWNTALTVGIAIDLVLLVALLGLSWQPFVTMR